MLNQTCENCGAEAKVSFVDSESGSCIPYCDECKQEFCEYEPKCYTIEELLDLLIVSRNKSAGRLKTSLDYKMLNTSIHITPKAYFQAKKDCLPPIFWLAQTMREYL